MTSATPAGPAAHLPEPMAMSVAVGNCKTGPAPQMNELALPGDR